MFLLVLLSSRASGHVARTWDWHKVADAQGNETDKTEIHYCIQPVDAKDGLPDGETWKQHLDAAAARWNAAGVPWKFKPTNQGTPDEGKPSDECQLELRIKDHNQGGGAMVTDREACDAPTIKGSRVRKLFLCVDPTPRSNTRDAAATWGPPAGFLPVAVLMHEIGHALRLEHPLYGDRDPILGDDGLPTGYKMPGGRVLTKEEYDRIKSDDALDMVEPGAADREISDQDKQEARDSADRTKTPIQEQPQPVTPQPRILRTPFPIFYSSATLPPPDIQLSIPEGFVRAATTFSWRALGGPTVPSGKAVPADYCPVSLAVEVDFTGIEKADAVADLRLPFLEMMLVEDFYDERTRAIREDQLTAMTLDSNGQWVPYVPAPRLDRVGNGVNVALSGGALHTIGLSGPCQPVTLIHTRSRAVIWAIAALVVLTLITLALVARRRPAQTTAG